MDVTKKWMSRKSGCHEKSGLGPPLGEADLAARDSAGRRDRVAQAEAGRGRARARQAPVLRCVTHVCMDTCDCLCIGLWFVRPWPPWTRFACITLLALVKRCTAVVVFPCRWIPSCSIKIQIDLRGFSQTTFTSPGPWPLNIIFTRGGV